MIEDRDLGKAKNSMLTQEEDQILESYDRLLDLQLEVELLKSYSTFSRDEPTSSVSEHDIITIQNELLKAKASYQIRFNITENVQIAKPIINAVHSTMKTSTHQQNLLLLLKKRDEVSLCLTQLSTKLTNLREELLKLETENMRLTCHNTKLTATMLDLVDNLNSISKATESPSTLQQIDDASRALKITRQRWKIIKGLVSGSIVGSSVDWARNPKLLETVLELD